LIGIIGTSAFADFEPLFQIVQITGECSVQRPDDSGFVPAEESKAYPYGTRVKTGKRSSLVIVLSEGNMCRVLANADLEMDEGVTNRKLKIIRLQEGEVEVELLEDFHTNGNALNVETATAICGAIGCHFRVASKVEEELRIIIVRVIEGMIRMHGENFATTTLDQNDWMSLLSPPDRSFLRIKNMKGEYPLEINDEDLQKKVIPTVEGAVLKIWQRHVPGTLQRVVTAVLTGPDGQLIETVTVTYGEGEGPSFGQEDGETPPWGEYGGPDAGPRPGEPGGDQPGGDERPSTGQEEGERENPKVDPTDPEADPDPDSGDDDNQVGRPTDPTPTGLR